MPSLEARFWPKVQKSADCWLWTAATHRNGYGKIGAGRQGDGTLLAHRVAWELTYGPISDGLWVLHHCDNPPCVRPDHLFLGTVKTNGQDMSAKGRGHLQKHPELAPRGPRNGAHTHPERVLRGEATGNAKLTAARVQEIRAGYAAGKRIAELARGYGVSWSNVKFIVSGQHWRHV